MKTDTYTKAVLTVIAICLTIIVVKQLNVIPDANAAVTIPNYNANMKYGLVPINEDGSINVNITSSTSTMDVSIVDINTFDELDVNIDEVGGFPTSSGKVPVEIK